MSESVPALASEILYNNTSGQTAGNSNLTIDTQYLGTRLQSQNLLVKNGMNITGNLGIHTATARQALEVTGNAILTAQGSASQGVNEFGLNGSYDTLSLVSPVGLGLNGTTSIFFGLNSVIYYPVARIVAVDNGNYSGSLAFQIGNGQKLYQQMRLTTNGIIIANGAFLHTTVNLPTPGTNLCLNFPSVNNGSVSIIEVYFTLQRCDSTFTVLDTAFINMAKCTIFLGNQLYVTGISLQKNGTSTLIIKPDGIKAVGSKVTLSYADTLNPYVATVNYMVYGPAANFITSIDTTLNDTGIATAPGIPMDFTASPRNLSAYLNWSPPSDGGSAITGYTIYTSTGYSVNSSGVLVSDPAKTLLIPVASVATTDITVTGLTNGITYTFTIKAKNAQGYSGTSSSSVTPAVVPGAPLSAVATSANGSIILNWVAPSSNGGSPITSYTITWIPAGTSGTTTSVSSPAIITGLTNGISYIFYIYATNVIGSSLTYATTNAISPMSVPDAPTIISVTAGYKSATVNWRTPASNGGSAILSYKIIYTNTSVTPNTATTTASTTGTFTVESTVISGLSDGINYTFNVIVSSIAGDSNPSNTSASITTFSVAGEPTAVTGTAGVNSINLSWVASILTGGSPITGYKVYDSSGNITYDGSGNLATTTTISGLSKATAYTFTVKAINIAGLSTASAASTAVTTYDVPGAPISVTSNADIRSATITWSAPALTGGSPITGYRIYDSSGIIIQYDGSGNLATTATIIGLSNGTTYNYLVKALNLVGASIGTAIFVTTYNTPGPPTGLTTVSANAAATLSWVAPISTGNSPILGYKIYDSSGNIYNSTTNTFVSDSSGTILTTSDPITTTLTLTGLVNGQTYAFTIKTNNAVGDSVAATFPSVIIGLPTAPTNLLAISANASAILSWSAPTLTGGSPILGYNVYDSSGNVKYNGSANTTTSTTITSLVNGQSYTFTVAALNANGTSGLSSAAQVTIGSPGTPLNLTATAGNTTLTLSWSAPSPGGSAITSYVTNDSSGNLITITSPIQFTGLTNKTQYTLSIYAVNSFGRSSVPASISVIPGLPSAPTNLTGIVSDGSVVLNWSAPSGSSLTPTGYKIYDTSGNIQYDGSGNLTTTSRISGLTNGLEYIFLVNSVNANGNSPDSASITIRPFTVPGAPGNLSATATSTSATLNWLAPSSNGATLTGYKVYDSSGNIYDSSGNVLSDTGSIYSTTGTTSYTITGLTSKLYTFTVKAANSAGNSLASSISVFPGTPGTPTSLSIVPGSGSVVLTWSAPLAGPPAQTSYKIIYAGITVLNSTSPKTITGLTNGSQYTFAVYSVNASGDSAAALISATPGLPFAPTNLTGSAGSGSVTLSWSAPSGGPTVTGYQVTVSSTTVLVTLTTLTISGLTTGTSYTFTVNSQNAYGNSTGSATISVTAA